MIIVIHTSIHPSIHGGIKVVCSCSLPDTAVPPWVGYSEEETIQQQILALSAVSSISNIVCPHSALRVCDLIPSNWISSLSECIVLLVPFSIWFKFNNFIVLLFQDRRNFLRDPPAGVQFQFDSEQMYPIAMVMLQEDELLNRMRFDLVPKQSADSHYKSNALQIHYCTSTQSYLQIEIAGIKLACWLMLVDASPVHW